MLMMPLFGNNLPNDAIDIHQGIIDESCPILDQYYMKKGQVEIIKPGGSSPTNVKKIEIGDNCRWIICLCTYMHFLMLFLHLDTFCFGSDLGWFDSIFLTLMTPMTPEIDR